MTRLLSGAPGGPSGTTMRVRSTGVLKPTRRSRTPWRNGRPWSSNGNSTIRSVSTCPGLLLMIMAFLAVPSPRCRVAGNARSATRCRRRCIEHCPSIGACRGNVSARLAFGANELDNVDGGTSCAVMHQESLFSYQRRLAYAHHTPGTVDGNPHGAMVSPVVCAVSRSRCNGARLGSEPGHRAAGRSAVHNGGRWRIPA